MAYLFRATFDSAGDQGYADGQVLDTAAEGVEAGQLTVVEKDGTLAVVSNKMAFTAQGSAVWGDLGAYSQAITRALGVSLLGTTNLDAVNKQVKLLGLQDAQDVGVTNRIYQFHVQTDADLQAIIEDGAGNRLEGPVVGVLSATTDYAFCIVLGGYDINGNPWYPGQTKADYTYGAHFLIAGGAFATYTRLWTTALGNTATLYAVFSNYDAAGTIDDILVPDYDFSAVQVPVAYSSFDAANGTSLDAITPEVGGAWTEQVGGWDIQSNRANPDGNAIATVDSGEADVMVDCTVQTGANQLGIMLRYADADNRWEIDVLDAQNLIRIVEENGGSRTVRASGAVAIADGVDYNLRAVAYGQTIDAFVDGGSKISYGSAALNETATLHGLRATDASDEFENFAVYARTPAAATTEFAKVGY